MATLATPAFAEIGCAEESVVHLQNASPIAEHGEALAAADQSDQNQDKGSPTGHCAFNHGHCAGIPMSGGAAAELPRLSVTYGIPKAKPLTAASIENPERPPNA